MHLLNLAINVVPHPTRFLLVNEPYFHDYKIDYHYPVGCKLNNETMDQECLDPETGLNSSGYSYAQWLFTMKPNVFGLVPGMSFPTGVVLITVISTMFACSLPFVRRGGHFEVFYFSHLLYVLYYGALIFHAPPTWLWVSVPVGIFLLEILYRGLSLVHSLNRGASFITDGIILPSKVTGLVIKRPDRFYFNPGDWVFVKIPAVAMFEWHPFTISSAPEEKGHFTLHIRGVGGWTNKLYNFVAEELRQHQEPQPEKRSRLQSIRGYHLHNELESIHELL